MCCKARSTAVFATKTLHSTSFATVARFELALDCGLRLRSKEAEEKAAVPFFNELPKLSSDPRGILTVARVRGAPWHKTLTSEAAFYGEFELLKWLHRSGCGWRPLHVGCNLIKSSRSSEERLSKLQWFKQQLGVQQLKTKMLFEACVFGCIPIAEYLLSEGAQWPPTFYGFIAHPTRIVKWVTGKGCSWGTWKCQELAPERFAEHRREVAEVMFEWAHSGETGCPCTCKAAAVQPVPTREN
jgi:hypothetical protein